MVRTAAEFVAVLKPNPFPDAEPGLAYTMFLDAAPPDDTVAKATGRTDEQMRLGNREIYVHYPSGMGRSKLCIPAAKAGTARNMSTVARLAEMAARR